jgi:hypothetical protein
MQMLLYEHPVNESRSARGLPVVNSFWLSGTGALPPDFKPAAGETPPVADSLREAALNEDWLAWAHAWEQLDATECATLLQALQQGEAVQLTLCGELATQTFVSDLSLRAKRGNPLSWIAAACGLAMTGPFNFKPPPVTRFLEPL